MVSLDESFAESVDAFLQISHGMQPHKKPGEEGPSGSRKAATASDATGRRPLGREETLLSKLLRHTKHSTTGLLALLPEMLGWMKSGQGYALEKLWPKIVASTVQGVAVVKAIEPSAAGVMKRREDEKSAGGAGAGAPDSKRAKVVKKKVKKNAKALGSGLSIWD